MSGNWIAESAPPGNAGPGGGVLRVSIGKWRGFMAAEPVCTDLLKLFSGKDFPAGDFPGEVNAVTSNIGGTFRVSLPGPEGERRFYAKSFLSRPWLEAVKGTFAPVEAARSWKAAWIMMEEGIPTPRPLALMEQKILGITTRSVFITEAIDHAEGDNLEMYLRENFDLSPLSKELVREKREIIRKIGETFRKVHAQNRIYFPDFHPHNMVFQKTPSGQVNLFLVDFDEVNFRVRRDDRMKNLSSLGRNAAKIQKRLERGSITGTDKMRFIKAYLGPGKDGPRQTRRFCEEVVSNWNLK
jgi:hypothetical protein